MRAVRGKSVDVPTAAALRGGLPEVTAEVLPQRVTPAVFPVTGPSGVPLSSMRSPRSPPWLRRSLTFISHPLTSARLRRSSPPSPPPHPLRPPVCLTCAAAHASAEPNEAHLRDPSRTALLRRSPAPSSALGWLEEVLNVMSGIRKPLTFFCLFWP